MTTTFKADLYEITFSDLQCTIVLGHEFVEVVGRDQVATLEEYTDSFEDIEALDKYFSLHSVFNNGFCN